MFVHTTPQSPDDRRTPRHHLSDGCPREAVENRVTQVQCMLSSIPQLLIPLSKRTQETDDRVDPHILRCKVLPNVVAEDHIVILEGRVDTWKEPEAAWQECVSGRGKCWESVGKWRMICSSMSRVGCERFTRHPTLTQRCTPPSCTSSSSSASLS